MQHLDRDTARALAEAGYLSPGEYLAMFPDQPVMTEARLEGTAIGHHRTRQWSVPAHFASPIRAARYQPNAKRRRSAA
jgi:hypothetical protein